MKYRGEGSEGGEGRKIQENTGKCRKMQVGAGSEGGEGSDEGRIIYRVAVRVF